MGNTAIEPTQLLAFAEKLWLTLRLRLATTFRWVSYNVNVTGPDARLVKVTRKEPPVSGLVDPEPG